MAKQASADVVAGIDAQIQGVIAEIDAQIGQLTQKKAALLGLFNTTAAAVAAPGAKRRGRPKGSTKGSAKAAKKASKTGRTRVFSEETKMRLREAAKARWARARAEKGEA